ncbi:hypothetical protein ACWDUL_25870 [Nocardia niigatensis]|uniref:hypothetical protein n=1 Tax=Nocardia niigatensis TaxID=209249 RepID=UPI000303CC13|nr:hypothetical protein [Nocardia niigatensis]
MRGSRPSEEQLRHNFESALAAARQGSGVRSETGLDAPTKDALWAIARAHPEIPDAMIAAAERSFAGQLDGSNAERWRAEMSRRIAEFGSAGQS